MAIKGQLGFTAAMNARLSKPLRIGKRVTGRGRITQEGSRIIKVEATLEQDEGIAFRGDFTFAVLDETGARKLIGDLPESWRKFCRPR